MTGPVLLIVCGLPYAGKSSLSRDLAAALGDATHIDMDAINRERGLGADGAGVPMSEWSMTYQIAYERMDQALLNGETVVFDAGNHSRAQRDVLRTRARQSGARSAVIHVNQTPEASRERWLSDESGAMSEPEFERIIDRFEPPTAAERVVLFLPGMSVDDLVSGVRQIFSQ